MITVVKDNLAVAVRELGRLRWENKVEGIAFNGQGMVLIAGCAAKGTWHTRTILANGPIPKSPCWNGSLRHLARMLNGIACSAVEFDCDGSRPRLMDADGSAHEWPAEPGAIGPTLGACEPVAALPWAILAKQLKKSTFHGLNTFLQPGSQFLQLVGTGKTVELVASNFTNRTVRALVEARQPGGKPFHINLGGDAVEWLSRARDGQVVMGENESLISLAIRQHDRETAAILLQKPADPIPDCRTMMVPRSQWGPGCLVNVRELKRAFAQLMAPAGGVYSGTVELAVQPGRLSLAGSFSMGTMKARVRVPCDASHSASARFDATALAPALRSVWTRELVIHWAGRQRLVLRSKGLIQYVNALG